MPLSPASCSTFDSMTSRSTGRPSLSKIATLLRVISATSPSSKKIKRRVTGNSAIWSEAIKFSPNPKPITRGLPERATTTRLGSSLSMITVPYAPWNSFTALCTARNSVSPVFNASCTVWAMVSVSVSLPNT